VQQSFAGSVHPDHKDDNALYAMHGAMSHANGSEAYVRHQEAIIARPDSGPLLKSIKVPTVIIVGEGDAVTPPEVAREMQEGIAGSRLVVISEAGHLALLEQPGMVTTALKEWAAA
jgi:pimeloyl-ACP methyl ester carboxylesterase